MNNLDKKLDEIFEELYVDLGGIHAQGREINHQDLDKLKREKSIKLKALFIESMLGLSTMQKEEMQGDYPVSHKHTWLETKIRNNLREEIEQELLGKSKMTFGDLMDAMEPQSPEAKRRRGKV